MKSALRVLIVTAVLATHAVLALESASGAVEVCLVRDPTNFCLEWGVPVEGSPASGGTGGPPSGAVTCDWVTIPTESVSQNPESWVHYGLEMPPPGVDVAWQTMECSDGSFRYQFRWVIVTTPANLASIARGRLLGVLAPPVVASSPPLGVASIIGVPVFVEVTNWSGTRTESACAGGLCVTVTASPVVSFAPGEPGSSSVLCAGSGSRYVPGGGDPVVQAGAPGACAYAYRLRTGLEGRPGVWPGSVSVTWALSWSASDGSSGLLVPVTLSTGVVRAVNEVQTVVVGGVGP